ncbi:MAG: hypothetical protein AAFQ81_05695 [Pseudomonadota bacterium]
MCIAVSFPRSVRVGTLLPPLLLLFIVLAPAVAEALVFRGTLEERRLETLIPDVVALGAGDAEAGFDTPVDPIDATGAAVEDPGSGGIVTPLPALFAQRYGAGPRRAGWRLSNAVVTLVTTANEQRGHAFDPLLGQGARAGLDLLPLCLVGGWVVDELGLGPLVDWITREQLPDGVPFPDDGSVAVPLPASAAMLLVAIGLVVARSTSPLKARRADGGRGAARWRRRARSPQDTKSPSPAPGP